MSHKKILRMVKRADKTNAQKYIDIINLLGYLLSYDVQYRHLGILRNVVTRKTKLAPLFGIDEIGNTPQEESYDIPAWLNINKLSDLKEAILNFKKEINDEHYRSCDIVLQNIEKNFRTNIICPSVFKTLG